MTPTPRTFASRKARTANDKPSDRFTILIAEDNEVNVKVLKALLGRFDCDVRIAMDGRKAVNIFDTHHVDLILMDIEMPLMDGFEATKAIRAMEAKKGLPQTPIIAVTAHIKPADQHLCIGASMNDYIHKPVTGANLTKSIGIWAPSLPYSPPDLKAAEV